MIIANLLADGFVVFMTEAHQWTKDIQKGAVADSEAAADALLMAARQAEQDCMVVGPNLIPVEIVAGSRRPTEYREYIRATGPSVPIPT